MVNDALTFGIDPACGDPARGLALGYAPGAARAGVAALFALDATCAKVVATTTDPMIGQLRMAWWREAVARIDTAPPPAQPVLVGLARDVLPAGVGAAALGHMIDAWEALLFDRADGAAALLRGEALFGAAGIVLGVRDDPVILAGRGWALADAGLRHAARKALDVALASRWSRAGRALGALAIAARAGLDGAPGPGLVARMLVHRMTGM